MDLCSDDQLFFIKRRDGAVVPVLLLNDVFAWATADGEEIPWELVPKLRDRIRAEGWDAGVRWAAERRDQEPIEPMQVIMKEACLKRTMGEVLLERTDHDGMLYSPRSEPNTCPLCGGTPMEWHDEDCPLLRYLEGVESVP